MTTAVRSLIASFDSLSEPERQEAALEKCRMSVGKPIVQSCMKAAGGTANLEACRAKATPQVRACVMAALNAANGRANVAVGIPAEAAAKTPAVNAVTESVAFSV